MQISSQANYSPSSMYQYHSFMSYSLTILPKRWMKYNHSYHPVECFAIGAGGGTTLSYPRLLFVYIIFPEGSRPVSK